VTQDFRSTVTRFDWNNFETERRKKKMKTMPA
jgi:hypothetical protein